VQPCIAQEFASFLLSGGSGLSGVTHAELAGSMELQVLSLEAPGLRKVALFGLFATAEDALCAEVRLRNASATFAAAVAANCSVALVPAAYPVYAWVADTTSDPFMHLPSGLRLEAVWHDPFCMSQGCWVLDVIFTLGSNDTTNVLYIPRARTIQRPPAPGVSPLADAAVCARQACLTTIPSCLKPTTRRRLRPLQSRTFRAVTRDTTRSLRRSALPVRALTTPEFL